MKRTMGITNLLIVVMTMIQTEGRPAGGMRINRENRP